LPRPLGRGLKWALNNSALAESIIWLNPKWIIKMSCHFPKVEFGSFALKKVIQFCTRLKNIYLAFVTSREIVIGSCTEELI